MTELRWSFQDFTGAVLGRERAAAQRALSDGAEFLLQEANRTVPIEEGHLAGSGAATVAYPEAAVSYDTPYAVIQHEAMEFRHDEGRRAKWLQLTMQEQAQAIMAHMGAALSGGLS